MTDPWRPRYHVTGERGWINDPNGPILHAGRRHLFFQAYPDGVAWGTPRWGHVSSADLVAWARHEDALLPTPGGPDADGCWSGCARLVDGRPALYYTGATGEPRVESVCRAWGSDDLLRWEKDDANPLIAPPPGDHRDPFLWQDREGWHMLLGVADGAVVHHSMDATRWRSGGTFATTAQPGELWECPHLLLDGEEATLIVSCQRDGVLLHAVAYTGRIAGGRFEGALAGRVDHGDVLYAPAVATDGARTLLWGWAQERDPPGGLTHAGALTLPRVVTVEGGRLLTRPAPELAGLRAASLEPGAVAPQMELRATLGPDGAWTLEGDGELRIGVEAGSLVVGALSAPLPRAGSPEVRVFVDGSLVEVFADGAAITTRAYVAWTAVRTEGDVSDARAWRLRDDVIG